MTDSIHSFSSQNVTDYESSTSSLLRLTTDPSSAPVYHPDYAVTDGLIVSTALSIVGCILVIFTYVRWRRLRRHPASLVVIRSCLDLGFCAEMLANHLYHRTGNIPSNDISDCKGFSFVSQFLTMAAELFGLMLSIDLYICISNPFSNYRSNLRTYHAIAWLTAIGLATLVLVCTEDNKPIYARDPYLDICWIRRTDNTGAMDAYFISLFIVPVVVIYSICIVALIIASRRLAYGLPESFEARLLVFRSSMRFVLSYILYWVTAGAVYGILALIGDSAPNEALDLVLAFALGSRGVVTFAVWMITWGQNVTCSRWGLTVKGQTTSSSAPIRQKVISQTIPTLDGTGQRNIGFFDEDDGADLRPHLNMALRREILYYATLGIVKSVTRAERTKNMDRITAGISYNQLHLSRQYEEKGLFALEKHKLEVNRVNHNTPNLTSLNPLPSLANHKGGFLRSNHNNELDMDDNHKMKEPLLPSAVTLQNTDNYDKKISLMGKRVMSGMNSVAGSHVNLTTLTTVSSDQDLSAKDPDNISQYTKSSLNSNYKPIMSLNNDHNNHQSTIEDKTNAPLSNIGTLSSSSSTRIKPKLVHSVSSMLEAAGNDEIQKLHRLSSTISNKTTSTSSTNTPNKTNNKKSSSSASTRDDFTFLDFEPHLFARMRELHGISNDDYITSLSRTRRERFSEGASGAFLYYSRCDRFIVKTMNKEECDVLLRLLHDYVIYIERHPHSLLTRYYGCHALSMYGNVMYFVVMQNMMASGGATIHERYDLKGSWINRHSVALERGQKTECRHCGTVYKVGRKAILNQCPARPNHEHEPNQTMRDMDWTYKLRLDRETAQALGDMIVRDTEFLRRHNIMDYSLILGIHRAKYRLIEALNPSYGDTQSSQSREGSIMTNLHTNTLHHSNSEGELTHSTSINHNNIHPHSISDHRNISHHPSHASPKLVHQSSFLGVLAREPSNSAILQPVHEDLEQKTHIRQLSQTSESTMGDKTPAVVVLGTTNSIGGHILHSHIHPINNSINHHSKPSNSTVYANHASPDDSGFITPIDGNNQREYTPLALEPINTPYINGNNSNVSSSNIPSTPLADTSLILPPSAVNTTTIQNYAVHLHNNPIVGMKEDEVPVMDDDMEHPDEIDPHHHKNILNITSTSTIPTNVYAPPPIHIPGNTASTISRTTTGHSTDHHHHNSSTTTATRHPSIQLRVPEGRQGSVVPFFAQYRGGMRATIVEGPGLYYVGIIDMLQTFTWSKWLENFFKTRILWRPMDGVSCIPPDAYAARFRKRVIGQLVDGYEEAMDSEYEEDDFI